MDSLTAEWRARFGSHRLRNKILAAFTNFPLAPSKRVDYADVLGLINDAGMLPQDAKNLMNLEVCRRGCTWRQLLGEIEREIMGSKVFLIEIMQSN